jgi:hypothetical protein
MLPNTPSMHVCRGGACPARPIPFPIFSVTSVHSVNSVLNPFSFCYEARP